VNLPALLFPLALSTFAAALQSDGPAPEVAKGVSVYDWLIGSWTVDVVDLDGDGVQHANRGEWHFAWVLEGRAVQDVWIVPTRAERNEQTPRQNNRYGTTLRVYDASQGVWNITWNNPVSGNVTRLVGRRVGNDVVHEGSDDDGALMRWSFRDITRSSFLWVGERSRDGGRTWVLEAEFRGRRMQRHGVRDAMWTSVTDGGFEHLRLSFAESGIVADGVIVRRAKNRTYRVRYVIETDTNWRVRSVQLIPLDHSSRRMALRSNGDGRWTDEADRPVPSLDGCTDIDIAASPFTNTLAIERLALKPAESRSIHVVFIDPADLTFRPVEQKYTRGETSTYRYESLDSGFAADLPVDSEGLLLEYPGFFRRVW